LVVCLSVILSPSYRFVYVVTYPLTFPYAIFAGWFTITNT
jgi:hypothetical protein